MKCPMCQKPLEESISPLWSYFKYGQEDVKKFWKCPHCLHEYLTVAGIFRQIKQPGKKPIRVNAFEISAMFQ